MDAKEGVLSLTDILKIIFRKFFRLAPVYYSLWLIIWVLTYYTGEGPIWYWGYGNMATCKDEWLATALMVGNLNTNEMVPF